MEGLLGRGNSTGDMRLGDIGERGNGFGEPMEDVGRDVGG